MSTKDHFQWEATDNMNIQHKYNIVYIVNWASTQENLTFRGFCESDTQISLLSFKDHLENCNFNCSKLRYVMFQKGNNKGSDQSAQMRRLV